MTTYVQVAFSTIAPPTFQAILDGETYNIALLWNLFGQRYYVQCTDGTGNIVFSVALTESPESQDINTLSWDGAALTADMTTVNPHGLPIGLTVNLTIAGASPDGWNGQYSMLVTGPSSLTFPLSNFPGAVVTPGSLSYLISLCAGYFNSTMVWRNQQFEINP